ncbi:MAG TPA: alkaline phosphatase family protein [Candidatus Baltobacteraceae bacterium]
MTSFATLACAVLLALLPDNWVLAPAPPLTTGTDTMPQGAAASPDRKTLAVLCAGYNHPTLRLYRTSDLEQTESVPLEGAFGRPVWIDGAHVAVAGAGADAILVVDTAAQTVRSIVLGKGTYPTEITRSGKMFAVATDKDFSVRIGTLDEIASAKPVKIGGHIGGLAFSAGGKTVFASNWSARSVDAIDTRTLHTVRVATGLHPSDILVTGNTIYVAQTDADTVGVYDASTLRKRNDVFVGDSAGSTRLAGGSPNALAARGNTVFVSLGAANSIAVLQNGRVAGRMPAGWYPTDVVPVGTHLFVIDGKGEGTSPNPYFKSQNTKSDYGYIGTIEYGSIRAYNLPATTYAGSPQGSLGWSTPHDDPVVRKNGPIRHVFFILKENRTYDQILGDMPQGNGDAKLAWFGKRVTPNEHAIAERFGLFDNAYTTGEVSEAGHDWTDAAFVTDYVQRNWPATYASRGNDDASIPGVYATVPRNGYIWQAAFASHVSFRDYGEMTNTPEVAVASLNGHYDKHFVSWNLKYSDVDRVKEWRREFGTFLAAGTLPQLEYIWLPSDHTAGSSPGYLTPAAMIAQNDYAVGQVVDTISHSPIWKSSAIFIIEDDSQDGPDHVSDQRTTMFVISPYSRGGVQRAHYSTVSILRTMEMMLGIAPLSTYDAMAMPLYAAFTATPNLAPYAAIAPEINVHAVNGKLAYGAALSAKLDFSRPDATRPGILNDIIAHNQGESNGRP